MRNLNLLCSLGLTAAGCVPLFAAAGVPDAHVSCRATLSLADARTLAAASPNARGFAENLHATLSTEVVRSGNGNAYIRVLAAEPHAKPAEVGVYTVSLRTGRVTDDDQEPAEDGTTAAVRARLMARHCGAKP